ncbi:MAG: hypothetical protein GF401_01825 [Chitinivibrionales bacterium]|nr:hypothetical protein [Chitinivibrionales bacterium]
MYFPNPYRIFIETIVRGGPLIMLVIFGVALVAWYIGFSKLLFFTRFNKARKEFLRSVNSLIKGNSPERITTGYEAYDMLLARLVDCAKKKCILSDKSFKQLFREFLIASVPDLTGGFSTMNTWISAAPLLGLFGTVTGMIKTFQVITSFGVGNPALTAEGISIALRTTQAGLTVAFPAMLLHNYLFNRKNLIVGNVLKDGEDLMTSLKSFPSSPPAAQPEKENKSDV